MNPPQGANSPTPTPVMLARIQGVLQGHSYYCRAGQTSPELANETMLALQQDLPAIETEHAALTEELISLNGENQELEKVIESSGVEIDRLTTEHAQLVARVASLEGALETADTFIQEIKNELIRIGEWGRKNEPLNNAAIIVRTIEYHQKTHPCKNPPALLSPVPQEGQKK